MKKNNKEYPPYFVIGVNKEKIKDFFHYLKFCCGVFIIFMFLALIFDFSYQPEVEKVVSNNLETPDCDNLSFENTSICLNNFVRSIFIYNVTDDNINLSFEDLKRRGGDCLNWVIFYNESMSYYGFKNNQMVKMLVNTEKIKGIEIEYYHIFLLSTDKTGYCTFDMRDLQCYRFVEGDST